MTAKEWEGAARSFDRGGTLWTGGKRPTLRLMSPPSPFPLTFTFTRIDTFSYIRFCEDHDCESTGHLTQSIHYLYTHFRFRFLSLDLLSCPRQTLSSIPSSSPVSCFSFLSGSFSPLPPPIILSLPRLLSLPTLAFTFPFKWSI